MILVTGGAGYIGSHTCVALAAVGMDFAIVDNFCNSSRSVLGRLERLVGRVVEFHEGDVRDEGFLERVFARGGITAVMHFAGLKAVGESGRIPLDYFDNNVSGSLHVLKAMARVGCRRFVFSSSATVYGDAKTMPISERAPVGATNPYGRSKLIVEDMLADLEQSDPSWHVARLRYFNPVGAHESGLIGENPRGTPNNLMPYVAQVAAGLRPRLQVFGEDYPTHDGTGVRDYVHVMDLAEGHVAALKFLESQRRGIVVNLGTGRGTSVREMVRAFERASGRPVPFELVPRRPGDVASCFADVRKAEDSLGWRARRDVDQMCLDAWRWQQSASSR
ncbi:MAG: UDP-glucose 4-epimerase GalE [Proteobacteria bacterium]|nr:UDP-glucose 4-epimerase GalE [Pseudomonadota bacterium]